MKITRCWFVFIFGLLLTPVVLALSVKDVPLNRMIEMSEVIFKGKLMGLSVEDDVESGEVVTQYTFSCEDVIKGSCEGGEIVMKQLTLWPSGLPKYEVGTTYLIMKSYESKLGFAAPIGFWQGYSEIKTEGGEERLTNKGLVKKMGQIAQTNQTLQLSLNSLSSASEQSYGRARAILSSLVKENQ